MNIEKLLIELTKYKYLMDLSGYPESYQEKHKIALETVLSEIANQLLEERDEI